MNSTAPPTPKSGAWTWIQPYLLAVPFAAVVTGLFNLGEVMPLPLAVTVGAGWGILLGIVASVIKRWKAMFAAWCEDGLVFVGTIAFAFAGCGGLMAILLLNGALDSSSLTGEALEHMFLPSIPYYIIVNSLLELLVIPAVLFFGWRAGKRRAMIVGAAVLYFAMRVWTYLAFVPARLGWAESDHATERLTEAELDQAAEDLMVDDPRWALLLLMLVTFLVAAHFSRVRELRQSAVEPRTGPTVGSAV